MPKKISTIIGAIVGAVIAFLCGATINMIIDHGDTGDTVEFKVDTTYSLEVAEEQKDVTVDVVDNGEAKTIDVITVEKVDGGEIPTENDGKHESELNLGHGEYYDATTPKTWVDSTYGKCIDMDGWFGSQCVDYFAAFTMQQYGYWPSTNGTGAAYGIWDAREYNAGGECGEIINGKQRCKYMTIVYELDKTQVGTFDVYNGGLYGHIGEQYSLPVGGYSLLAGENQGGAACPGGGAAVNIINMSTANWRGGFIPNEWLEPEPEPEPVVDGTIYHYVDGDTFGQVILNLGLATENGLWGREGDVEYYNGQLYDQGILNYYDGKFWNNIPVGTEIKLEHR